MKRKGMIMIELLLVVGILTGLAAFYFTNIYRPMMRTAEQKNEARKMVELEAFIKNYIIAVSEFNMGQYDMDSPDTAVNLVQLEPLNGNLSRGSTFLLDTEVIAGRLELAQSLSAMQCFVSGTAGNRLTAYACNVNGSMNPQIYRLTTTYDNGGATRNVGGVINNIYSLQSPQFLIEKVNVGDNTVEIGMIRRPALDAVYRTLREGSIERLQVIRKRLVDFAKTVYIEEINTPCGVAGGLDSWDDSNIPWIWKVNSQVATSPLSVRCSVSPVVANPACGCTNHAENANWSTSDTGIQMSSVDTASGFVTVLGNLSLNADFLCDTAGNPLELILFSNGDGGRNIETAPLAPAPNYSVSVAGATSNLMVKQGELGVLTNANSQVTEPRSRALFFYE